MLLLTKTPEAQVAGWIDQLRQDDRAADVEHIVLQEEVERPIYNAFFDNLPASLSKGSNAFEKTVYRQRFFTLASPYISSWLNTDSRSYHLALRARYDTLFFSVRPYTRDTTPVDRIRLFDQLNDIDRALRLLEGDDPRLQQARALLESYKDSLETEVVYGNQ